MRRISVKLVLLLATVAASLGWGQPTISAISPTSVPAGSSAITLTVYGTNFVVNLNAAGQSTVFVGGVQLATTFVNSGTLTAAVPASLLVSPAQYNVQVANPGTPAQGGAVSNAATFSVLAPGISSLSATSIPAGSPAFALTVAGANFLSGSQIWFRGTALATTFVNNATLTTTVPANLIATAGQVSVLVVNPGGASSDAVSFVVGPPGVSISPNSSVPSGVVGVAYTGLIVATGGTAPYTFSLKGGNLPDGLTLASGGAISGTPKTPGQFAFTAGVTDAKGGTGGGDFSIAITTAPLNITGGPAGTYATGTPVSITFTATGGVGPYRYVQSGNLPPGTSFSNGVLSGTPTTAGTFAFRITITDSTGAVFYKDYTITITQAAPPSLTLGGSLSDGKVGVPYTGQITATGGVSPYSYAGTGLPGGLSLAAGGGISGTPTTAGQFTLSATATDSAGATASARFPFTIAAPDLGIVTLSLPDGAVGVAYSASLTASGGVPPYTWTVTGLPAGVTATAAGTISGTPTAAGTFTVSASVKDAAGVSTAKSYSVTIVPAALVITTASAPNGTVGTAYSAGFAASGGTAPYTFSASGLPAGLSMSAAGTISGTPTAPGAATIVVSVRDAAGVSASKSFAVTIALPPAPALNVTGISDTASPLQQPSLQVTLGSAYPVDVVVNLTLTFTPDSGADDPTIQFSSGGRTAQITVPAGTTNGATAVGVQTGTVAGLITITAKLQASGQDITPSPAPSRTIRIAAAAPVIVAGTLTAVRNSTGFTVTLTGYVTDREMTQAVFVFTAAAGSSLQTTTLTVPLDALFVQYFGGSSATPFGSQFKYTQPFTVTGSTQAIASVTVTLANKIGQSTATAATLN